MPASAAGRADISPVPLATELLLAHDRIEVLGLVGPAGLDF